MDKVVYIALQLLGIKNNTLIDIINLIPNKEVKKFFEKDLMEIQYKYNIDISSYMMLFKDSQIIKKNMKKAEHILEINKKLKIKTILINSKFYPTNLKKINNPPAILYIKGGNIKKQDEKSIACVGTRNPTIFGKKAVNSIVSSLAKESFTIISGLAYGIDAEAHKTCLTAKGRTIAVLAHGLDMIYPKENMKLAEEILNSGGILVSEYPVETKPEKFRFVDRNKIISGLSKGTIVFETKEKSGTMHTVNYTLKQDKKVFCPIPLRYELETAGLIKLLKENKAIGIRTKDNYDLVVKELGYKIVNDKNKISQIKSESIDNIINNFDIRLEHLNNLKNKEFDGRGSFGINKNVYSTFKDILKENNLTVKEFFNGIIFSIVDNYKKGE
ncbi:DNA-protecting protein DprA [Clostridiaceae bacterium 14S0207]|nr:DNA-protecting protein DprA [Clostridiaceae bacterium 14S0207]